MTNQWRTHFAALLLVLLAHAAFVAWLFTVRPHAFHSLHREVADIAAVLLIQLPPPPPPSADATPAERTNVSKPAPKLALSETDAESKLESDDGPPKHGMGSGVDWANTISTPATIATGPRRVPSDYADKVKAKVVANLVRPEGAVFKPQGGDKADAKYLLRQCTIPYEVTVDREGKVLSIKIESCGDKLLDAAAEAALHKSAPFPPPPNAGASSYVIYGSANFRAQ